MAIWYKTGRTRTITLTINVSIGARLILASGSGPGDLGVGSSYTSLSETESVYVDYSSGFNFRPCQGQKAGTDPFNPVAAVGVRVPSLYNNGFVPLAFASPNGAISASCRIDRVMLLEEQVSHEDNGQRREVYGPTGTCYQTYTVEGQVFTAYDHTLGFVPGQAAGDGISSGSLPGFGYNTSLKCWTTQGLISNGGGARSVTWSASYGDTSGWGSPIIPTVSNAVGTITDGLLSVNAMTPGSSGAGRREINATVSYYPRHVFAVEVAPRSLPDGAATSEYHILQADRASGPASIYTYVSAGETTNIEAGGGRWSATMGSTATGDSAVASTTSAYNDYKPLVQALAVGHSTARPHYYCQIFAPFGVINVLQDTTKAIPSAASLACPVGLTTLTLDEYIGYRYLRIRGSTASGTGSLTIDSYVYVSGASAPALSCSEVLTTVTAGVAVEVELDLLSIAGCTYTDYLRLDRLELTATGAAFVVESATLFVKDESILQSLGSRRSLFPLAMPNVQPWLIGYTDGVRSLMQSITGDISGNLTVASFTPRQLVAEINGTTRHDYSTWSPSWPFSQTTLGSAAASPPPLLGWSATDVAPPASGKDYGGSAILPSSALRDSDVYLPALHGDGILNGSLMLTGTPGTISAQRLAVRVSPGHLPGDFGWTGTAGAGLTSGPSDLYTPMRFVGLFRAAAHGMQIGEGRSLPIKETADILPDGSTVPLGTPVDNGFFIPRASGFSLSSLPLRGEKDNGLRVNTVYNDGGTPASLDTADYIRNRQYLRFWTGGTIGDFLASATSATNRVVRGFTDASDTLILEFWRRMPTGSAWEPRTTPLTITGQGCLAYDKQSSQGRLWLAYEDSGAIKRRYTDDEGGSFSVAVTIASAGTYPAMAPSPTGIIHHFWVDGSAIKHKALDSQDNTVVATLTAVASGVAASAIDAVHDGTLIHLTYKSSGGAVVTVVSGDGGLTFS
jgi:hypothetical protein